MGIIQKLFGKGDGVPYSYFYNSGIMSSIISKPDALDFYKSWVFACVTLRSMAIANIDFKFYKMKGDNVIEVYDHPVLDLLYRVNPNTTKFDFLQLSMVYRDLLGSSPWILDDAKNPKNMFIARPEYFKEIRNKEGQIVKYVYEIGSYKKEFEPERVIFLKNYNPKNPDKGIGILEAVRMTAENDDMILQTNNSLLKNGAIASGFLETDREITTKEAKRLSKKARAKFQGFENAHKIQILQGGMKFKPNIIPPRDLEFIEGRNFNRDEILAVFNVPKALITSDNVNLANAKSAEYQFHKWTIEPLATQIVEQLNEFLVPKFDIDGWLGFEPLAKEDEELELKKKEVSWNKWKTTNEIREMEGGRPISGGDSIYMPISAQPVMDKKGVEQKHYIEIKSKRSVEGLVDLKTERYVKKRIKARNFRLNQEVDKFTEGVYKGIKKKSADNVTLKIVKSKKKLEIPKEKIERFYNIRIKTEDVLVAKLEKDFKRFFKEQKKRFKEALKTQKGLVENLGIDTQKEVEATFEVINPVMYEAVMQGAEQASDLIDMDAVMDLDFLEEWINEQSLESAKNITNTTVEAFESSISQGIAEGESINELSKRVNEVFDFNDRVRAERIARTETARGVVEAHRQTYKYYGFDEVKWLLEPDACPVCVEKEQNTWTIDSIKGEIPVHPNCRCDFYPV